MCVYISNSVIVSTKKCAEKDMLNKFTTEDMYNSANVKVGACRYANILSLLKS